MEDHFKGLRERMKPRPEGAALLGLSGGADSVALLYLLLPFRDAGQLHLEAVHVNHGIRGGEADGDERFSRELCEKEGVPFHSFRLSLGERRDENAARNGRYACFRTCLRETGIRQLILAHQRDDQAETFLMRLMRGAGPEGLGCMRPVEEREGYLLLRPMLDLGGAELREALRRSGIPWREDASNAENGYLRNRIRHGLLPRMEELVPGSARRIARTAEMIGTEHEALIRAESGPDGIAGKDWIRLEDLTGLPEAGRREALRRWWRRNGPRMEERALSYPQTEALTALTEAAPGTVINLPGGWRAERGREHLHLIPPEGGSLPPAAWQPEGTAFGPFFLESGPSEGTPGDGAFSQEVPPDFLEGCEIRTRRPGDRIRPFGMKGSRLLQDYLTDRKIDRPWRDRIPLLCRGGEVLLAAGVGAGAVPEWRKDEPHIRLTWRGEMPWAGKEERA